jgi:hypothetical protein
MAERAECDDDTLRFYLMQTLKFSEDGAKRAVRSFRETAAFANLALGEYTVGSVQTEEPVTTAVSSVRGQAASVPRQPQPAGDEIIVTVPGVYDGTFASTGMSITERLDTAIEVLTLIRKRYKDHPEKWPIAPKD